MATSDREFLEIQELSKSQESRITNQIGRYLDKSGMRCEGQGSKFETMQAKRAEGAKGSHETHDNLRIFSYSTEDSYISCFRQFMRFVYLEYGLKQPEQTRPEMLRAFAVHLVDAGASQNTYQKYMSALSKFDNILEIATKNKVNWEKPLKDLRPLKTACPDKEHARAYDYPRILIKELDGNYKIAAQLQYYCGLRVADAVYIPADRWDPYTRTGIANSKGGQQIAFRPPPEVAVAISCKIEAEGKFSVRGYPYALKAACERLGIEFNGTHGLRANFAKERMEHYEKGCRLSHREALQRVSEEMGHHRPTITERYLR